MSRKTIVAAIGIMIVAAGAWSFRGALGAEGSAKAAVQDPHAGMDHSGHAEKRDPARQTAAASTQNGRKVLYWYDPMHPAYRSATPGKAPDCGMTLVAKYADDAAMSADMPHGTVRISAEKQQLIGVKLGRVEEQPLTKTLRAVATIAIDERWLSHAHTKVEGWIQDVFVNYVGEEVQHGDPLFTLYSPELLSAQQEYLIALKARKELADSSTPEIARSMEALFEAARERLQLWDLSEEQIRQLEDSGKPQRDVTFYAEHGGFVIERKALPHMRVEKNTDLYLIADLSQVWAIAEVYEYEAPLVRLGQTGRMTVAALPGRTFIGKVDYIYPQLDPQTRTLKVRLDFANPDLKLRPDMFANVEFTAALGQKLVVPEEALLDSGTRQYVFLHRGDGYFEPREVQIGMRTGGWVAIEHGLKRGDEIVVSGNFLIDSESKLKAAAGQMSGHQH